MNKKIYSILIFIIVLFSSCNETENKLNVLFVGFNPNSTQTKLKGRKLELRKNRIAEFKELLGKEFNLKIVFSEDYKPQLSKKYDVTIFDETPKPIGEVERSLYSMDRKMKLKKYLPDNFSSPSLFIGRVGDMMYITRPTKFQRKCICLAGYALNIRKDHKIFNEPNKVNLTIKKEKTPRGIFNFLNGKTMSDKIDMWKVQTEDYKDGQGYFIGEVLNGDGFNDSPDCEFISGGESDKDIDAMAIGRNGNMLHWGFSASPKFMTQEAKKVFINAIYYIKNFKGQIPYVDFLASAKTDLEFKLYRGYFKKELMEKFGNDKEKCKKYYLENWDYTYAKGMSKFFVDEDAKEMGIALNDKKILDACIQLLHKEESFQKGIRLLKKYTHKSFETKLEWENWYSKNKNQLFYSEVGGYKFYSNAETGNKSKLNQIKNTKTITNKEDDKVQIKLSCRHLEKNIYEAKVEFKIKENWHIYSFVPENAAYQQTKIQFEFPNNYKALGSIIQPEGKVYESNPDIKIYYGDIQFTQKFEVSSKKNNQIINCKIDYQACDLSSCDLPKSKVLQLKL